MFLEMRPTQRLMHRRLQASRAASTPVTDALNEGEAAAFDGSRFCLRFFLAAGGKRPPQAAPMKCLWAFHRKACGWEELTRITEVVKMPLGKTSRLFPRRNEGACIVVSLCILVASAHPGRLALWPLSPRKPSSCQ